MSLDLPKPDYSHKEWRELANLARQQSVLAGFYNDNYRLVHDGHALLFRFPKEDVEQFDPRPFKEHDVYKLIADQGLPAPNLFYVSPDEDFQVFEFINGALVDELCPPGQEITENHIERITKFYKKVAQLELDVSDVISKDWPLKGPQLIFLEKLFEKSWFVYKDHQNTHRHIYEFLKLPEDPYAIFLKRAGELTKRPWRLIHSDLHRQNMIEKEDGQLIMIDWELALYGDILYCVASHLHRSRFFPDEKELIAKRIYEALPQDFQKNYMKDLSFYLDFEALSSIIGDTVRFPQLFKKRAFSDTTMNELSVYYSDNLNRISDILGTRKTTPEEALKWFEEWPG